MNTYAFFLGSNITMSASEIWHVLQSEQFSPQLVGFQKRAFVVTVSKPLPSHFLSRLGGCERIVEILTEFPQVPSAEQVLECIAPLSDKWMLGLSSLPMSHNINLKRLAVDMKKSARSQGSRLKFITPNKYQLLSSAQVFNNELHLSPNAELLFLEVDGRLLMGRTIDVQNIAEYELRDTSRPARDAKIGMLPPKVAQVMLNLALAHLPASAQKPYTILDAFCGTGVVLQEALLQGYDAVGSDKNPDMVAASKKNIDWLRTTFPIQSSQHATIHHHDIREPYPSEFHTMIDAAVSEPYLGAPLSSPLPLKQLDERIQELGNLYISFFRHTHPLLKREGTVLLLLPATRVASHKETSFQLFPDRYFQAFEQEGFERIPLIPKHLQKYLSPTPRNTFIYGRPDALVAREFTLWKKV